MSFSFLFVTWDGGGNTPPELAIARRLVARGHRVRVLADPTLEHDASAAGCTFTPWTTAPHRTTRDRSGDVVRDYEWTSPLATIRIREFLGEPAPRWAADTMAELRQRPVDVVVAEQALPATFIPAEALGIPLVSLVPNIWILPTPGIPPIGPGFAPARGPVGWTRDAIGRWLTRQAFASATAPINATRATYGLEPVADVHDQMLRVEEIYVLTSPAFDLTSPDMPAHVYYAGPQLDEPAWVDPFAPSWNPDDDRPRVLVGLSSTFQKQVAVLSRISDVLSALPVQAIVTLGPVIQPSEVPYAPNVTVVPSAPHSALLQEAALLVTHGGHGTTMKGLAAGVPLVCLPMGRDQHDTAARVVHRGAGLRLKPDAAADQVSAAIVEVLSNPKYREHAREQAEAIASGEGCIDPVVSLERLAARRNTT